MIAAAREITGTPDGGKGDVRRFRYYSPSPFIRIYFDTPSPLTCWKPASISVRFRPCRVLTAATLSPDIELARGNVPF